jgi:hypothetical protein
LICVGVDPRAVNDEPFATGTGIYAEAREIVGIPSDVWLAVRGRIPCAGDDGRLAHQWYLVQAEVTPALLEQWGEAIGAVVLR